MKPLVYIAGKYRDARGTYYVEQNIRVAEEVAKELWQVGFSVICPHLNTRHLDGPITAEQFLQGDFEQIRRSDAIVMLPNWKKSEGAKREHELAGDMMVPIYYWPLDRLELMSDFAPDLVGSGAVETTIKC